MMQNWQTAISTSDNVHAPSTHQTCGNVQGRCTAKYGMDSVMPARKYNTSKRGDDEVDCEMCHKKIDNTNPKKKRSAVMLVFCAVHGHCIGFHVTPNERRRDAFLPLFTYMRNAPATVFYDFVCRCLHCPISRSC